MASARSCFVSVGAGLREGLGANAATIKPRRPRDRMTRINFRDRVMIGYLRGLVSSGMESDQVLSDNNRTTATEIHDGNRRDARFDDGRGVRQAARSWLSGRTGPGEGRRDGCAGSKAWVCLP